MYLFGLNYLSNRKFKVNLTKKSSEPGKRLCGVPQESILGPLLFFLYINDLPQAVKSDLLWDADDTCLIFKYSDINEIEGELNKNFSVICDFLKWDSLHAKLNSHYEAWSYKKKKHNKD